MALKTYVSPGIFDDHIGTTNILGTTTTLSPTGIFTAPFTAPNTTNKCTGVWVFFALIPTVSGTNCTFTLQQSTVDTTAVAVMNNADIKYGWNYARFSTPFQFTTTAAGAYRFKLQNPSSNAQVRLSSSLAAYTATIDTGASLTSSDDIWVGGFHNSGLTPQTLTLSGSVTFGTGADKAMTTGTIQTIGAGLTIGAGGVCKVDTSVSTTLQIRGSIYTTDGGLFDWRANLSDKTKVAKIIFDCETADGNYGIMNASGVSGGNFLLQGATYDRTNTYVSGVGTAASPLIVSTAWDADVGDEIVIGGANTGTNDYQKNETRYIKTRNSSTSFVLSTTPGGAEAALTYTHAVGSHIGNMASNCIVTALTTTRGYWIHNLALRPVATTIASLDYARCEWSSSASGRGINAMLGSTTLDNYCTLDGLVIYKNSLGNRNALNIQATTSVQTIKDIVAYGTLCTNLSNGAIGLATASNKTFNNCLVFNETLSTAGGEGITVSTSSYKNTFNNCHVYGGNASGTGTNSSIYVASSGSNTFNDCTVNASRVRAIALGSSTNTVFNNCNFGNIATNTVEISPVSATQNTALFNNCTFGSATLIDNYLNQLEDSDIAFQDMDGNTSKHRWYTNRGSFWSSGTGLTDTTVRTSGSLSLAIKPQNNTLGAEMFFKIPANPTSQVVVFGYLYRNATFSSGVLKVDLFLPGTLLTDTPDATQTMPTTTATWLAFNLSAYNSSTVSRYAIVRITAVSATVGAYAFLDDIYDAGLTNKVAGLDLWDEGHISPIMVQNDFSVVASQVWGYPDDNTQVDTMGQRQVDAVDNQILPNLLIKDKLS